MPEFNNMSYEFGSFAYAVNFVNKKLLCKIS